MKKIVINKKFIIGLIILSILTICIYKLYPSSINQTYEGLITGEYPFIKKTTMNVKARFYKSLNGNIKRIKGTIEIDFRGIADMNKKEFKFDVKRLQDNEYLICSLDTDTGEILGIMKSPLDMSAIRVRIVKYLEVEIEGEIIKTPLFIFAPAKKRGDFWIIDKKIHGKNLSNTNS